jgi:hypothetical protein
MLHAAHNQACNGDVWMQRRYFFGATRGWALAGLALLMCLGTQAKAQARYTVSADQLQQLVAQRFPLRYSVAGLVNMDVQAPALRLLPEANRLNAEMALDAARRRWPGA